MPSEVPPLDAAYQFKTPDVALAPSVTVLVPHPAPGVVVNVGLFTVMALEFKMLVLVDVQFNVTLFKAKKSLPLEPESRIQRILCVPAEIGVFTETVCALPVVPELQLTAVPTVVQAPPEIEICKSME